MHTYIHELIRDNSCNRCCANYPKLPFSRLVSAVVRAFTFTTLIQTTLVLSPTLFKFIHTFGTCKEEAGVVHIFIALLFHSLIQAIELCELHMIACVFTG